MKKLSVEKNKLSSREVEADAVDTTDSVLEAIQPIRYYLSEAMEEIEVIDSMLESNEKGEYDDKMEGYFEDSLKSVFKLLEGHIKVISKEAPKAKKSIEKALKENTASVTSQKQMSKEELVKIFDKLKPKQEIKVWYRSVSSKDGEGLPFIVGRRSKSNKHNVEKITLQTPEGSGVKFFFYKRERNGEESVSMAIGDMGVSLMAIET